MADDATFQMHVDFEELLARVRAKHALRRRRETVRSATIDELLGYEPRSRWEKRDTPRHFTYDQLSDWYD